MRLIPFFTALCSPPAQPAIHSRMLNLRRLDLWARATYADTKKVSMLLGSIPTKLFLSKSYIGNMPKACFSNTYLMSNLYLEKLQFLGRLIGDQHVCYVCLFATFAQVLSAVLITKLSRYLIDDRRLTINRHRQLTINRQIFRSWIGLHC